MNKGGVYKFISRGSEACVEQIAVHKESQWISISVMRALPSTMEAKRRTNAQSRLCEVKSSGLYDNEAENKVTNIKMPKEY